MAATKYIKLPAAAIDIRRYLSAEFTKVAASISSIVDILDAMEEPLVWTTPTFVNGWTAYTSAPYDVAQYAKDVFGFVHLRGLLDGASATDPVAFTLPTGHRPSHTLLFPTATNVNDVGRLDVGSDGTVSINGPTLPINHASINFSFYAGS